MTKQKSGYYNCWWR